MNNFMARKYIAYFNMCGTPDADERLTKKLIETFRVKKDVDYVVSLLTLECSSLFPNIIKDKSDRFYYSEPPGVTSGAGDVLTGGPPGQPKIKVITLDPGAYEIKKLGLRINEAVGQNSIQIELDAATGRSQIKLKPDYKVHFVGNRTFREMLGYPEDELLEDALNVSPKMCNVVSTQRIFVEMQGIQGSIFKSAPSHNLFKFPNQLKFGLPLVLKPIQKQQNILQVDYLNLLNFKFKDQDSRHVNFMNTPVSMTIEIRQV